MFGGGSSKPKGRPRRDTRMRDSTASQRDNKRQENEEIEL